TRWPVLAKIQALPSIWPSMIRSPMARLRRRTSLSRLRQKGKKRAISTTVLTGDTSPCLRNCHGEKSHDGEAHALTSARRAGTLDDAQLLPSRDAAIDIVDHP